MTNLIGQSVGRYHILEQLGEGGMAVVYKAYDTHLQIDVAVKVIRSETITRDKTGKSVKRFEREARALAKLNHPNIVKVTDYGEYEGSPYLVMPLLSGGTLKGKLGKPIVWHEAAALLLPIARALAYAHQHGIIHRDVKPSNILITDGGEPLLSDFGVAKMLEVEETIELTGTGVGIGTPEYMAPEQGMGHRVDQRADIYSLGVIFYEMVAGRKPFRADTPMAVLYKQMTEPLPRPRDFAPNLPQEVENILFKALAKKSEDRYQNMAEFAKAMEKLTGDKSTVKKIVIPKTKEAPIRGKRAEFKLPVISRRAAITVGLIALVLGLLAVFFKPFSALLAQLFATPAPSSTATPAFTSTPRNTPTSLFTATPDATNMPTVSPTPTLGIGSTWIRPADGMEMVYVPEGEFTMGSNDGLDNEKPAHQVYLDAYWIDRTEVTDAMYALCVLAGPCKNNPATSGRSSHNDRRPVASIQWDDAQSYCSWAEVRLPTEAEWEKAARGTDGRIYPWGNDNDHAKYYVFDWRSGNNKSVGSYPSGASPYGAFDMAGGVIEWTSDWYGSTYYQNSPSSNPQGPDSGDYHVWRGGSWYLNVISVRSAGRNGLVPPDSDVSIVGFRCARHVASP